MEEKASFRDRNACISCQSPNLLELASGQFSEEPLYSFLKKDPWGTSPLPFIEHETWSFVQCETCGQKFHNRILDDRWLEKFYSEWISKESIDSFYEDVFHHQLHDVKFAKAKHAVERLLTIERDTRGLRGTAPVKILDFGCGDGEFLVACSLFGFESFGVEFSASRQQRQQIEFFPDLAALTAEFPDVKVHAVTLFQVLEHLSDPRMTLIELAKCLEPGGLLVLETPNCASVNGIHTEEDYRLIHPLGHINAFSPQTMEQIAGKAGFERIRPALPQVTTEFKRVVKREVRRLVDQFRAPPATEIFFRKIR